MVFSGIILEANQSHGANASIKSKAKELRKNPTSTEKELWKYVRNGQICGMYFRKQHPFGIYILDFYSFKANLVIEIDGPIHLLQKDYDDERDKFLKSTGLTVLRFTNRDIEKRLEWVLSRIKSFSPLGETGKGVKLIKNISYESP